MPTDSPISDPDAALWLAALRAGGRRPATLKHYRWCVEQFIQWWEQPVSEVERENALAYASYLTDRYRAASAASILRSVRSMYSWLEREGVVEENPFRRLVVKVPEDSTRPVPTSDEVDRMIRSAARDPRAAAILTLLADTGCRRSEAASLKPEDVDEASALVTFRVSKTRARTVPLSERALVALAKWIRRRHRDPRTAAHSSLWSLDAPGDLVRRVVEKHSNGRYSAHAFRRAFAVNWLLAGGSESSLVRIAGWRGTEMVRLYTQTAADEVAAAELARIVR